MQKKMRRRWGDRKDGRLLKHSDPFMKIIPYIMKKRVDGNVAASARIYIDETDAFVKRLRREEGLKMGFLHVLIAALVRTISQKPKINRFVSGRKVYARNEISVSLTVKKDMSEDAPETVVKITFEPEDTIYDIVEKVNAEILPNKDVNAKNDADKTVGIIMWTPHFVIKFLWWLFEVLDNKGWLPKFLFKVSPFHSSVFITDLGSLGIGPAYHHLYEFGTTSMFIAFGTKGKERKLNYKGDLEVKKYVDSRVMMDERIVDGYYYARAMKYFNHVIAHPEELLLPPEKVVEDNEI